MNMARAGAEAAFRICWEKRAPAQVEREIESMRRHMQKHAGHYAFHGRTAHPDELTDGDRLRILREILEDES